MSLERAPEDDDTFPVPSRVGSPGGRIRIGRVVIPFLVALILAVNLAAVLAQSWEPVANTLGAIAPGRSGLAVALALFAFDSVAFALLAAYVFGERFVAAMLLVGPYVPGLAATVTVVAYLTIGPGTPSSSDAAYIGLVCGFGAWPFLALPLRSMCTVERAQTRTYLELMQRSRQLEIRLGGIDRTGLGREAATAYAEATSQLQYARALLADQPLDPASSRPVPLSNQGIRWVVGTGYIEATRALHRTEEALIEIEEMNAVIGDALHDDLSLENSTIRDHDHLRDLIRVAVRALDDNTASLLFPDARAGVTPMSAPLKDLSRGRSSARSASRSTTSGTRRRPASLLPGSTCCGRSCSWRLAFYLLVGLAVLDGISKDELVAASVFFLVGAVVGLFNRLRIEGGRPTGVSDFGLFQARLLHTPIVSGLAAVAGVLIVAVSPSFFSALGVSASAPGSGRWR